ncbi:MAG: 50S ribosomal protein L24 [Opitutales bacterium]
MAAALKTGDEVVVITGSQKGKRGKIQKFIKKNNRIIVEGVNMVKKHVKQNPQNPEGDEGGIVEQEGSIHYSNVMLASKFDAKASA